MRYTLTPIHCRPWLLNGLSMPLIESHYENNYGGALRRLNAITEQLEGLDIATTPRHVISSLKREELIALNSTLLHELYFASLAFGDSAPSGMLAEALERDFGSVDRWRDEFIAIANSLAGGSGWVLLVYVPRDRRLIIQAAGDHGQTIAGGIPILALDMYEHAYHIDFGANAKAYVEAFMRNIDWKAVQGRYEDASKVEPPRPLVQEEFGDLPGVGRQAGAVHRCAAALLHLAHPGHHQGRHLARPRQAAAMGRRPVAGQAGRGVLRLRLPYRLQDRGRAARGRL
jgi:Fe-Mn family superoxide dismutase